MKTFYTKKGRLIGQAWSMMTCDLTRKTYENHKPHTHDHRLYAYGPYVCPGYPIKKIYDTPPRKAINE